jgi:hypothetical protein
MLYDQVITESSNGSHVKQRRSQQDWREKVPDGVADLIEEHWQIVENFARSSDCTLRVIGMKIPKDGFI